MKTADILVVCHKYLENLIIFTDVEKSHERKALLNTVHSLNWKKLISLMFSDT